MTAAERLIAHLNARREGTGEPIAAAALQAAERYARHVARDEAVSFFPTVEDGVSVDTSSTIWHFAPDGSSTLVDADEP